MLSFFDVFVPDGDDARKAAADELEKALYEPSRPTWFDEAANSVWQTIQSIFSTDAASAGGSIGLIIVCAVVLAGIIAVLVLWGRPRRQHSRAHMHQSLLGATDDRTATQLRADAEEAARKQMWDEAIVLRFRALATMLLERDIIAPAPGATAQAIAREASQALPARQGDIVTAARLFDDVRYLRRPGTPEHYSELSACDDAVSHAQLVTA